MLIVLALSSSNILDKSQGAAAEMVLLQFTRKAAQLQAANGKDGVGNRAYIRRSDPKKTQRDTVQRYFSYTMDAATEM